MTLRSHGSNRLFIVGVWLVGVLVSAGAPTWQTEGVSSSVTSYIVQAASTDAAGAAVERAGGSVTQGLPIIDVLPQH